MWPRSSGPKNNFPLRRDQRKANPTFQVAFRATVTDGMSIMSSDTKHFNTQNDTI
jgi:hypothetical protein